MNECPVCGVVSVEVRPGRPHEMVCMVEGCEGWEFPRSSAKEGDAKRFIREVVEAVTPLDGPDPSTPVRVPNHDPACRFAKEVKTEGKT